MKKKKFYISTAIAYSSAIPHVGNVYEAILADAIARFKRLDGYDVYFQTGTDEHGQKIEEKANMDNISPQMYVDKISNEIKNIYDKMNVKYDRFIRTTDSFHVEGVKKIVNKLYEQGDIYLGKYEGWYSVADEAYISQNDIKDGKGPSGDIPIWTSEEVYFLKLKKYQKKLIKHIEKNPNFIMPVSRKNEMLQNFLKDDLPDLSISRTSFKWGIPIEFNKNHVTYVWIDALSNYITSLGYEPYNELSENFLKYWPADIHLIGKDILRFHTIYWPILLMALNLQLPKHIFGHPWVLFDKMKMSKSTGNVVYIDDLLKYFKVDVVRYYLLHEIPYSQDGNLTIELLMERNNSDLSNTIGNLVNRTIGMVKKYRGGSFKKVILDEMFEYSLKEKSLALLKKMKEHIEIFDVSSAIEEILILARFANKYIDISKPWELFKNGDDEILDHVLYSLLETIRFIATLLQPFLPESADNIFKMINSNDKGFESLKKFGKLKPSLLSESNVLFERFDINKKINEILGEKFDENK